MAEYGEWSRKGATLSHLTAEKEYGVSLEFIEEGIHAGRLEWRHGAVWGNPYVRVLRSQLEPYVAERLGADYLLQRKAKTDLPKINREIDELTQRLAELRARKAELEAALR